MAKYRVKKHRQIMYPDGSLRGQQGYIIDGDKGYERATLLNHADDLERVERQSPVSPINQSMMIETIAKKTTKKKAAKKKATKKITKKA